MTPDFPYQAGDDVRLVADPSHLDAVVEVHGQLAELRNGLKYSAAELLPAPPSDEQWLDLPGYDGRFRLSSHGKLLNLRYNAKRPGSAGARHRLMKPVPQAPGKPRIYRLPPEHGGGPSKTLTVAQLVAQHFLPPRPAHYARPAVRYLDGNYRNMRSDNLAWYDQADTGDDALNAALKRGNVLSAAQTTEALDAIASGASRPEVAAKFGVKVDAVKGLARRRGVPTAAQRARKRLTAGTKDRIAAALQAGAGVAEVADAFQVDRNTVYRVKRAVPPSPPGAGR